uniref:DOG1 domain-containing protein n=1 Tax=Aegilops tauschii TaxID=37682 RepID=M8AHG1_AEGTA
MAHAGDMAAFYDAWVGREEEIVSDLTGALGARRRDALAPLVDAAMDHVAAYYQRKASLADRDVVAALDQPVAQPAGAHLPVGVGVEARAGVPLRGRLGRRGPAPAPRAGGPARGHGGRREGGGPGGGGHAGVAGGAARAGGAAPAPAAPAERRPGRRGRGRDNYSNDGMHWTELCAYMEGLSFAIQGSDSPIAIEMDWLTTVAMIQDTGIG